MDLLECPHYTKPQIWEEKKCSRSTYYRGIMKKLKTGVYLKSEAITRDRRPDLWQKYKKN